MEAPDALCCAHGESEALPTRNARRRLWEVQPKYLCSVVGTCLRVSEIRRQAVKDRLCPPDISDYDLHGLVVRCCKSRTKTSRAFQKLLDRRFSVAVKQASGISDIAGLAAYWKEMVDVGRVAEGYWAVMTHPLAELPFVDEVFGDVHMLSHVLGANRQLELRQLDQAREAAEVAERRVRSLRTALRSERAAREAAEARCGEQEQVIARLQARLDALADARERIGDLEADVATGADELDEERAARLLAERSLRRLQGTHDQCLEALRTVADERDAVVAELAVAEERLERCLGEEPEEPLDVLQGASVLYVGGRTGLLRHYRQVVEEAGGEFHHHDGGVEESTTRLDPQVGSVDVVVCAVDAVSHDASLRVKGACRRLGRRFVPLRSSGVSSLSLALRELRSMGRGPSCDGPTVF